MTDACLNVASVIRKRHNARAVICYSTHHNTAQPFVPCVGKICIVPRYHFLGLVLVPSSTVQFAVHRSQGARLLAFPF